MDNERLDDIVLLDEAGEPAHFEHILTFLYEKERYIALSPLLEGEEPDEDEAEVLLNEVFDHFLDLMDELSEEGE